MATMLYTTRLVTVVLVFSLLFTQIVFAAVLEEQLIFDSEDDGGQQFLYNTTEGTVTSIDLKLRKLATNYSSTRVQFRDNGVTYNSNLVEFTTSGNKDATYVFPVPIDLVPDSGDRWFKFVNVSGGTVNIKGSFADTYGGGVCWRNYPFTLCTSNQDLYFIINGTLPVVFDILGSSTSPSQLMAYVTGGVQDTGSQNWPLLAFLGVPTSFIIGRWVVGFIRAAV